MRRSDEHPVFARLWAFAMRWLQPPAIRRQRSRLAAGLTGVVVEVGCGSGSAFAHYEAGGGIERVIAVEPDSYLVGKARQAAERGPVPVHVSRGSAEHLPLGDGEADAVLCSLVLCSVPDQAAALAEIARVLKPGGELRYYEHVIDHPRTRTRKVQQWLDHTGLWPWVGAGCHCARDTTSAIRNAGFQITSEHRSNFGPPVVVPVRPHVSGVALKG